jgi:hypothetical protein
MKKLLCLFALIGCAFQVQAQNLVFNGNFEIYTTCPTVLSQVPNCLGWSQYTSGSSDYFNCSLVPYYSFFGYQQPANGYAYVGGFASINDTATANTYKEYIAGTLTTPMTVGATYQVSMSVNLADQSKFGTDDIGMFFFKDGVTKYNSFTSIPPVTPQVTFGTFGAISSTVSWIRLTNSFFADSAYDKIVIGSWKEAAASNHAPGNSNGAAFSYYYYDSVVVSVTSKISTSYSDSLLCTGGTMTVPYVVHFPGYFQGGNTFILQLSDAAGSFANPTVLATQAGTTSGSFTLNVPTVAPGTGYRIRVASSYPVDVSNESLKPISIGNALPAKPEITTSNPCMGQTLNFSCIGTPGATYKWKGPGSFTSELQNPVINPVNSGTNGDYIVTAWLYGCPSLDTETITVKASPAPITASCNSPVCNNSTLELNSTSSTAGATYSWVGPGSFVVNSKNCIISNVPLSASGNYMITATLNGCSVSSSVSVTVLTKPMNVSTTANTPLCEGGNLSLNVTNSTPGVSYSWTGPNSFASSIQNPVKSNVGLADTGKYIVELNINGCIVKDTIAVVVKPAPGTPAINSNSPVCNGNTLNLFAGGTLPGSVFSWTGPGFTSTQQAPVINNVHSGMAGNYTVVANLNGCTSIPVSTNVTILYFPSSVSVYVLPKDTICVGSSIQLIAVASNGGTNPQFQWLKNGFAIPAATAVSYTTGNMVTGDKFSVELIPDNTCPTPDTSMEIKVTVLPWVAPSVSITASPAGPISPWQMVTFKATPVNGGKNPTYQWKRNGQNVVGAVNDIWGAYTLSDDDTISVVMYSSDYCPKPASATSNNIVINVKLGVDDVDNTAGLVLYPNPNNGIFTLKGNIDTDKPVSAEVWNSIGQMVYRNSLQPHNGMLSEEIILDENLAPGVYILKLNTKEGSQLLRFTLSE